MAEDGRTMRDRMLAGEPPVFDESLAEDTRRCRELLHRINAAAPDQDDERDALLRELLGLLPQLGLVTRQLLELALQILL